MFTYGILIKGGWLLISMPNTEFSILEQIVVYYLTN